MLQHRKLVADVSCWFYVFLCFLMVMPAIDSYFLLSLSVLLRDYASGIDLIVKTEHNIPMNWEISSSNRMFFKSCSNGNEGDRA